MRSWGSLVCRLGGHRGGGNRAVADADAQLTAGRGLLVGRDHLGTRAVARNDLDYGVAAGERGGGAERGDLRAQSRDLLLLGAEHVLDIAANEGEIAVELVAAVGDGLHRISEHGPRADGVEVAALALNPAAQGAGHAGAGFGDERVLLGGVRDDAFGGIGRRRRAHVRNVVEDGGVRLVADGGDYGRLRRDDGALEGLFREGKQVFDGAAAAGDDNHVDVRVCVEDLQRADDGADSFGALDRGVFHAELDVWPAALGHGEDVALCMGAARGNKTDLVRQIGQRLLAGGIEEPLTGELLAEHLDARQEVAQADLPDVVDHDGKLAAALVEVGLAVDDDAVALCGARLHGAELAGGYAQGNRLVLVDVAEYEECESPLRLVIDLGKLALDPQVAELINPPLDGVVDHGDGPWGLGRRRGMRHRVTYLNVRRNYRRVHPVYCFCPIVGTLGFMSEAGKNVLLAAPRGYCAGVDRAVETVEKALEKYGAPIYVRKQIVHNRYVVESLSERGVIFVDEASEAPEGAHLVFSAHGIAPTVRAEAKARNQITLDATCPLVTKVHKEAQRFHRDGYHILLVGHEGHEEVEGTAGEAPEVTHLVDGLDGVAALPDWLQDEKLIWLSQTTLSVDETMVIVNALRERFPHLENPPSDDICYATQNRQGSVKAIAPKCDLMIVVGSKNSSNSVRLVEVALEAGSKDAHLVDFAKEIQEEWLDGVTTVGVTCGASVPELLVREVLEFLDERGYSDVEQVTTSTETITFALPRDLRPARVK